MSIKKILLILGVAALTACNAATPVVAETKKDVKPYVYVPRSYVSISCISHDGAPYISNFSIEEPISSGPLGGRMANGASCGGIIAAGYAVPKIWYPGMRVKVRWKPNGRDYVEKTTNIMQYDEPGTIYVHFFKNDQVRVVVAAFNGPGNPRHPISMTLENPPPEGK